MRVLKAFTPGLFLSVLLVACSPVYRTDYAYIPPTSAQGKTCIFQCENTKIQCIQLEEMRYERCLDRADREYDRCERNKRYGYNKKGEWECQDNCYCFRSSCTLNESRCEERYRSCYQTCGGKVEGNTYCVSNCDKVAK
ncbi:hypothetical protein OAO01_08870 [Oligoflexia bacterium]|nr:hypothetical protein [Oligoflexia bacterium]